MDGGGVGCVDGECEGGAVSREEGGAELHVGDFLGAEGVVSRGKLCQQLDKGDFADAWHDGVAREVPCEARKLLVKGDGGLKGVVWQLGDGAQAFLQGLLDGGKRHATVYA